MRGPVLYRVCVDNHCRSGHGGRVGFFVFSRHGTLAWGSVSISHGRVGTAVLRRYRDQMARRGVSVLLVDRDPEGLLL